MDKIDIDKYATRAVNYNAKLKNGGFGLKHKPSCYGIAIKYLLFTRGKTLAEFAKLIKITPQGLNHILNRTDKDKFYVETLERYCDILRVKYDFFFEFCDKIQEKLDKMGEKDSVQQK